MFDIKRVAVVTDSNTIPPYSSPGYIIGQDGTVYTLLRQYWHGAILALLYPQLAEEHGYTIPDDPDEVNVFTMQRFELDHGRSLPVIRICPSRIMGPMTIDCGIHGANDAQVVALRSIIAALGCDGNTTINMNHIDVKLRDVWNHLNDLRDQHNQVDIDTYVLIPPEGYDA